MDNKNPVAANRTNPVKGMMLVKDFVWNAADQEWESRSIYDPQSCNSYSVYMKMESKGKLKLHGYIGISVIG